MFSGEVRRLLFQVITSWQVLAVTVVLIVYVFIVNYVARVYHHRPRDSFMPKTTGGDTTDTDLPEAPAPSESDDLGLEEPDADN